MGWVAQLGWVARLGRPGRIPKFVHLLNKFEVFLKNIKRNQWFLQKHKVFVRKPLDFGTGNKATHPDPRPTRQTTQDKTTTTTI